MDTMETKQTAVEWLEEQMIIGNFLFTKRLFEEAKQMEKEQIFNAWINGDIDGCVWEEDNKLQAEQYYNETYGPQVDKK